VHDDDREIRGSTLGARAFSAAAMTVARPPIFAKPQLRCGFFVIYATS
jgi:hypothetical protein